MRPARRGRQLRRFRIQTNGRCEAADAARRHVRSGRVRGVPARLRGDRLERQGRPARCRPLHVDPLRRPGHDRPRARRPALRRRRLAVTLAFAWAAYPFTQYVSSSNTNDAIQPVLLIFGFWLVTSPPARGALLRARRAGRSSRALVLVPLWATYPDARRPRPALIFGAALPRRDGGRVLDPPPRRQSGARGACLLATGRCRRRSAASRRSRSGTGGSTTPASPTCTCSSTSLEGLLVAAALILAPSCRARKSPLQLAALSAAALLVGFEIVLTHWFYALPRLVLPVRGLRPPIAGCRTRAGDAQPSPMDARFASWSHGLKGLAAAAVALAAMVRLRGRLGRSPLRLLRGQPHRRHAGVPALRRRDRWMGRSRTTTSRSSTRPLRCPSSRSRR